MGKGGVMNVLGNFFYHKIIRKVSHSILLYLLKFPINRQWTRYEGVGHTTVEQTGTWTRVPRNLIPILAMNTESRSAFIASGGSKLWLLVIVKSFVFRIFTYSSYKYVDK